MQDASQEVLFNNNVKKFRFFWSIFDVWRWLWRLWFNLKYRKYIDFCLCVYRKDRELNTVNSLQNIIALLMKESFETVLFYITFRLAFIIHFKNQKSRELFSCWFFYFNPIRKISPFLSHFVGCILWVLSQKPAIYILTNCNKRISK